MGASAGRRRRGGVQPRHLATYRRGHLGAVQLDCPHHVLVRRIAHAHVQQQLRDFVLPYINLRNQGRGYAVSIVKAGCRVIGRDAGPVRSPLTDLSAAEDAQLAALIEKVAPYALPIPA